MYEDVVGVLWLVEECFVVGFMCIYVVCVGIDVVFVVYVGFEVVELENVVGDEIVGVGFGGEFVEVVVGIDVGFEDYVRWLVGVDVFGDFVEFVWCVE